MSTCAKTKEMRVREDNDLENGSHTWIALYAAAEAGGEVSRGWGLQSMSYISQGTCAEHWISRGLIYQCYC